MTDNLFPINFTEYPRTSVDPVSKVLTPVKESTTREIFKIIWTGVLGVDNKELTRLALFNNNNVITEAEQTLQSFRADKNNLRKYPRFEEEDWGL